MSVLKGAVVLVVTLFENLASVVADLGKLLETPALYHRKVNRATTPLTFWET